MKHPGLLVVTHAVMLLGGILGTCAWFAMADTLGARVIQELPSRSGEHVAIISRRHLFTVNLIVHLDGKKLYASPDFDARSSYPLRETLRWDDSGEVLILQVLNNRRLFAYDRRRKRALTKSETLALKASDLPVDKYGFDSEWPPASK